MIVKKLTSLLLLLLLASMALAEAAMSNEQKASLFNQANESFKKANAAKAESQRTGFYDEAILRYEKIINDGHVKNAKLYYNLANAYLLEGNLGKAILNYRRAEKLDSADANLQKNLAFARSRRIDKVDVKTEKQVLQTLFFWHYDFSLKTRFVLACLFFAIGCMSLTAIVWFGWSAWAKTVAIICAIFVICLAASVILETNEKAHKIGGVITANEVIARQGDGQNYPASFKEPLHEGTEFDLLEHRPGWMHIKLSDGADAWIPENTAEII
jgi:tetratricopeptide (TPR) repeat protein